jgi:hypothetical protein
MQPPVTDSTKQAVIQEYLKGKNRDPIATDLVLGTGTVSKIISEWKSGLDYPIAEELRELAVGLRKMAIPASLYAEGARIASYLIKFGVDAEEFSHFISELYSRCKKLDIQPDRVAYLLKQMLDLSELVTLSQIPEYVEQQMSRLQKLKKEVEDLERKLSDTKIRLDIALNEEGTTRYELNQFSSFKAEMKNNGLDKLDNSKLVSAIVGARQLGFNSRVIGEKVSNVEKLEIDQKALEERVGFLDKKRQKMELDCGYLEQEALVHTHRISLYKDLESMGMGIKELKLLWNTIVEIATANNISKDRASQKFFSDVREGYDDRLGFEVTLKNLKSEIQKNEVVQVQLSAYTATFNSIILGQFDQIQKVSSFVEFGPLVKAAKGEIVPTNQLKKALIKAIDVMISSDSTDRSAGILNTTKQFLQSDIQEPGNIV